MGPDSAGGDAFAKTWEQNVGSRRTTESRGRKLGGTIWPIPSPEGTMHNVTVSRSYGTAAYSFGPVDLLPVAKAANEAHSKTHEQWAAVRNSSRGDEGRKAGSKH